MRVCGFDIYGDWQKLLIHLPAWHIPNITPSTTT